MVRPVKAFDAILNAVVMELQRTQGAKVKLTLEIEAVADEGILRQRCKRGEGQRSPTQVQTGIDRLRRLSLRGV